MKKSIITTVFALGLPCFASGPVAAQNREHVQMAAELRMLQEQTQQLGLMLVQLGESLKAINARLDESRDTTRKSFADQKLIIDELGNDLRIVRERTQENNARVGTLREELEALRMALRTPPPPPPSYSADPADVSQSGDPQPPVFQPPVFQPPSPSAGASPERMFQTAWADYTSGQYPLAIIGFEQFLRTFPQFERADEAQFLIGESHYYQKRYPDAITAYNQVIQNYPRGSHVPLAYYKRGLAQSQLGQAEAARLSWEQVIMLYPNSQEAGLAKQNLDRLGGQTQR